MTSETFRRASFGLAIATFVATFAQAADFPVGEKTGTAIQRAIDAAAAAGGGRVVVPAGLYPSGSIRLRSHVELHLEKGARISGSVKWEDYFSFPESVCPITPEQSDKVFLYAWDAEDVAITGEGIVDGNGPSFFDRNAILWGCFWPKPATPRPRMVQLIRCRGIRFAGVMFKDPPSWTMLLRQCEDIVFDGIRVHANQHIVNSDGVDFDTCRHVRVRNCSFITGDDCFAIRAIRLPGSDERAVCEDILVEDCTLDSACQTVRMGCPSDDEIRNVTFRNIRARGTRGINFDYPARYLSPGSEGFMDIHDILFENYTGDFDYEAIRMDVEPGIKVRGIRDITYRNVDVTARRGTRFVGNVHSKMDNVRFENVTVNGVRQADGPIAADCTATGALKRADGASWETMKKRK